MQSEIAEIVKFVEENIVWQYDSEKDSVVLQKFLEENFEIKRKEKNNKEDGVEKPF